MKKIAKNKTAKSQQSIDVLHTHTHTHNQFLPMCICEGNAIYINEVTCIKMQVNFNMQKIRN